MKLGDINDFSALTSEELNPAVSGAQSKEKIRCCAKLNGFAMKFSDPGKRFFNQGVPFYRAATSRLAVVDTPFN